MEATPIFSRLPCTGYETESRIKHLDNGLLKCGLVSVFTGSSIVVRFNNT